MSTGLRSAAQDPWLLACTGWEGTEPCPAGGDAAGGGQKAAEAHPEVRFSGNYTMLCANFVCPVLSFATFPYSHALSWDAADLFRSPARRWAGPDCLLCCGATAAQAYVLRHCHRAHHRHHHRARRREALEPREQTLTRSVLTKAVTPPF